MASSIPVVAALDPDSGATPHSNINLIVKVTRICNLRCTYCHVGNEGEPLSSYDFPSDQKPEKNKAREMLRMVGAINGEYLTKLADRRTPPINADRHAVPTARPTLPGRRPIERIHLVSAAEGRARTGSPTR